MGPSRTAQTGTAAAPPLDFQVLGSLEVRQNGSTLTVKGRSERALLALLLTSPGRVFSVSSIVSGLWGVGAPPTADRTVQQYVSRLRRSLPADVVVTRAPGYLVDARPEQVDAERFRLLVRQGRAELSTGEASAAANTLGDALQMWHGEPYGEFDHVAFAAGERTALHELRLAALEDRMQAELALGAGGELVGEIEALLSRHPLRERLWAQLMTAFYRSGRQADALAAYQRARKVLSDELGVEPGPELRTVEARVLAHDERLVPQILTLDRALPPPMAAVGPTFIAREHELQVLVDALDRAGAGHVVRVLVVGPRGIGKTRLLAELGRIAFERGATVQYARGDGPVPRGTATGVAVLAYDDLQEASLEHLGALAAGVQLATPPALLLFAAVESELSEAHRFLLRRLADDTVRLPPLAAEEVATLVRLYVPDAQVTQALAEVEAAAGLPLDVHDRASRWAESWAARKVGEAAAALPTSRHELRAVSGDIVDGVVDLQRARAQRAAHSPDRPAAAVCPYKGLVAFEQADAPYFFGRERLTAELVARLVGSPLLAVVGASGSGKSSVVRAGLLPALAGGVLPGSRHWTLRVTAPHVEPPDLPPDTRTVLVIDQFEELFTAQSHRERQAYVDRIISLMDVHTDRLSVVVTLRADYFGRCAEHPELASLVSANTVLVPPMTSDEMRSAVADPARVVGLDVEPGAVEAIVDDAGHEPGALPLVSTALLSLWGWRHGQRLTLAAYRGSGGVRGAVAELAETTYQALTAEQQLVARRTLLRLGERGEGAAFVRTRVPLGEVAPSNDRDARVVLDTLADRRLLTVSGDTVEVAHEALLHEWPRLRDWLEEDEAGRALRAHLAPAAREWDERGHDETELYRGPRLVTALHWADAHGTDLTLTERAFLDESSAAADRDAHAKRRTIRRLRFGAVGLAALLVAASGAGLAAMQQRDDAERSSFAADMRTLQAEALDEDRWDRALLYAAQAQRFDPSPDSRAALLQTVQRGPEATAIFTADEPLHSLVASADGSRIVAGGSNGGVFVFDTRTRQVQEVPGVSAWDTNKIDISPDGRYLASVSVPVELHQQERLDWRLIIADLGQTPPTVRYLDHETRGGPRFAADSRTILTVGGDGSIHYVDVGTGREQRTIDLGFVSSPYAQKTITGPESRRFAVAADRQLGSVVAWDVTTGEELWSTAEADPLVAAISPDGSRLVLGHADGRVELVDVRSGVSTPATAAPAEGLIDVTWAPDGSTFAAATQERSVLVVDAETVEVDIVLRGHWGKITQVAYSPDGTTLYAAALDQSVLAWDLTGSRGVVRDVEGTRPSADAQIAAMAADGSVLAVGYEEAEGARVEVTEIPGGDTFEVAVPVSPLNGWALAADHLGRSVVLGLMEFAEVQHRHFWVHTIDVEQRRLLPHRVELHYRTHTDAVPTWDNDYILAVGGRQVSLWELETGDPSAPALYEAADSALLGVHPDGRTAALSQQDRVEVVDLRTGDLIRTLPSVDGRGGVPGPVVFSPDGRWLAAASGTGRVAVWDTEMWQRRTAWQAVPGFGVNSMVFTPDSSFLVTGGAGEAAIWNVRQGGTGGVQLEVDPSRRDTSVLVGVRDAGRTLVTFTHGTGVRAWDVAPEGLLEHACRVAGRDLTEDEWKDVLPDRPYERTCGGRGSS